VRGVAERYAELWQVLHEERTLPFVERHDAAAEVGR
jgi:hypothetical protein